MGGKVAGRTPMVGDVAALPIPLGGFGACQLTAVDQQTVTAYLLDWWSPQRPELAPLTGSGPMLVDSYSWSGAPHHVNVFRPWDVPIGFTWLGNLPVPADMLVGTTMSTGWASLGVVVLAQRRWERELPAAVKSAYRAGATRGQIELDFGAGPVTVGAAIRRLDLGQGSPVPVPVDGPVRWAALDLLPRCTTIFWTGPDRGLTAALRQHPIIATLDWYDAPSEVDLSGTMLSSVTVRGGQLRSLQLPPTALDLSLADTGKVAIDAVEHGRWLTVAVEDGSGGPVLPTGVEGARSIFLRGGGTISVAGIQEFLELERLSVKWQGPPGALAHADALAVPGRLQRLQFIDGYALTAETLPELPSLSLVEVDGIPRSAVTRFRDRYRRSGVEVHIHGAKSDTWLRANLTNPLRDWVDDHAVGGAAACRAYTDALSGITKLAGRRPDRVEDLLHTFVRSLNKIEERYGFIDTIRREEAGEVFAALATEAGVSEERAAEWFDAWRDF